MEVSTTEAIGSAAGTIIMVPVVIAWILGAAFLVTGIGRALAYEWPSVPLKPGRRCRKALWERKGTVLRRNDDTSPRRTIEAYDIEWDPTEDAPAETQVQCWRCHTRPEALLPYLIRHKLWQLAY